MTIEIDIMLGNTKNGMKHLGKNTNDEEEDDKKTKKGPVGDSPKKCEKKHFSLDHDNLDLNSVESNWTKIMLIEKTMTNFFKIFTSNGPDELNETIQDR